MLQIFYKHFEHEKWTGMNNWFILCVGLILEDWKLLEICKINHIAVLGDRLSVRKEQSQFFKSIIV